MAPRAYWKGMLRLSLVAVPVRLFPAVDSAQAVTLHQIHAPTGERIRYQKVVPHQGPVSDDEIVKAYEYDPGRYVTFTEEELERLKLETVHAIEIVQFIENDEIDPMYYHRPYFLAPDGAVADEAFGVIREALRRTRTVGLGQVVLGGRERIVALRPCGRGMLIEALRYEDELRESRAVFRHITDEPVDPDQLALATQLIEAKSAPFDPSLFHDRYQDALRDLVAMKIEQQEPVTAETEEPTGGNVIDLMEALRRSVSQSRKGGGRSTSRDAGQAGVQDTRRTRNA